MGARMFRTLYCLTGEHDLRLVALAGLVCFLASLVAISVFHRACASRGGESWPRLSVRADVEQQHGFRP